MAASDAAELRAETDMPMTPLDALYLARLCAYDDGQYQLFLPLDTPSASAFESGGCPPHLSSSDEVLAALLQQAEMRVGTMYGAESTAAKNFT